MKITKYQSVHAPPIGVTKARVRPNQNEQSPGASSRSVASAKTATSGCKPNTSTAKTCWSSPPFPIAPKSGYEITAVTRRYRRNSNLLSHIRGCEACTFAAPQRRNTVTSPMKILNEGKANKATRLLPQPASENVGRATSPFPPPR